MSPILKAAIF